MAKQAEELGEDLDVAANDAVVNDVQPDGDDGLPSTPSPQDDQATETLAQNPDIQSTFKRVFGDDGAGSEDDEAAPEGRTRSTRSQDRRRRREEEAEELEGLDGDEADDGIEPDEGEDDDAEPEGTPRGEDADEQSDGEEGDDSPTLAPLLRQAAKRAGWNDEDIDELYAAHPQMAERQFQRVLSSFNDLSAQFGRLGQTIMEGEQPPAQPGQRRQPRRAPQRNDQDEDDGDDLLTSLYGPDRVGALREKYGADFMDDVVKPMLEPVRQMQAQYAAAQQDQVAQEIGGFFRGLDKSFSTLYGEGDQVSEEQIGNRQQLALMADAIHVGAAQHGVDLSVKECLERANMQFAAEHMAELTRKEITKQVKKRADRITHRPTQRRRRSSDAERGENAAASAYRQKAAELGLDLSGMGGE